MGRLRYLTAGESHGQALLGILEGLPSGLPVSIDVIETELARRRQGHGRGPRMKVERDALQVVAGVRGGVTLGSPVGISIGNSEWEKWKHVMPVEGVPAGNELTRPRPGHADLAGMLKYDFEDARNVLERASARETAVRVALGALAKQLLRTVKVSVLSHVVQIGSVRATSDRLPTPEDVGLLDASPVRCLDVSSTEQMVAAIDAVAREGDSLGGVVEVMAYGLPPGLGSHVHWDRKLDGRLGGALMAVPAIKGVEFGDAFQIAGERGSASHDEIEADLTRSTVRAGGTEGGMTVGGLVRVRCAMKPLSTLKKRLRTVDMKTGQAAEAFQERTDTCAVPAAAVVCEAVMALVLADAVLEMFGGDTVGDVRAAYERYTDRVTARSRR